MIALLLAQLVMPSPSVEPLSPPGMVCMGECSDGPMVWRASPARGRLVVACDMRSDTCSDGRKITTERATPVPCETSPGVWETVGVDEGCYGVRGLESWASTTSYLSWGAELDREVWSTFSGASVDKVGTVWRVHGTSTESLLEQRVPGGVVEGETWTVACRVRAGTSSTIQLYPVSAAAGGNPENTTLSAGWQTVSTTRTATAAGNGGVFFRPARGAPGYVELAGCWLTKTDTPGRACWGGEAPVTCAADRHTISTEGWPTEAGEIVSVVRWAKESSGNAYIIDARTSEHLDSLRLLVSSVTEARRLFLFIGSELIAASASLEWEIGRTYVVSVERGSDGTITLRRDGSVLAEASGPALSWGDVATLGAQRSLISWQFLDGSLGPLRIRSTE